MIKIKNRDMLLAVTIVFVAGALLRRVFPLAGLIVMACALLFYLLCRARRAFRSMRRFSSADTNAKALVFVWFGMLLLEVNVLWVAILNEGTVSYFFVLVLLGADFLLHQNNPKNEK